MLRKPWLQLVLACTMTTLTLPGVAADKETPVLMMGDSMMRLLSIELEKELRAGGVEPVASFSSLGSGLARLDAFDWFAKVEELMAQHKPRTVIATLGANDRQPLKDGSGRVIPVNTPEWQHEYKLRMGRIVDEILKGGARRVVWLLLPDMREAVHQEYATMLNGLAREIAADVKYAESVQLFEMGPMLTRRPGTFSMYVMAPNGAALTVRDSDGIHLARPGAQRVAHAIVKKYWP